MKRWTALVVILLSLGVQSVLAASATATVNIIVDLTPPPAPSITVTPAGEWTNQDVTVQVSGVTDKGPAGVQKVEYSLDDGVTWTADTSKNDFGFAVTSEGIHAIRVRTYDTVGHISPETTAAVRIDKTNPTITVSGVADGQVYFTPPTPHYELADINGSGIDPTSASIVLTNAAGQEITWAKDTSITSEGSYTLSLAVSDRAGNRVNQTIEFTVSRPQAPAAPTLTAQSPTETDVSWQAVVGATGYRVSLDGEEPLDVGNVLTYRHSGLTPNTQHTYYVVAYNQIGPSSASPAASRWTLASPAANLTVLNRTTATLDVGWDGNGNSAGTTYQVSLTDESGRHETAVQSDDSLHHLFSALELGVKYTVSVAAVNGDGVAAEAVALECYSNRAPVLVLSSPVNGTLYSEQGESRVITVSGTVTDADRDDVTITVTLDGVVKTAIVSGDGVPTFSLVYDVVADQISEGNLTLTVTADDGK